MKLLLSALFVSCFVSPIKGSAVPTSVEATDPGSSSNPAASKTNRSIGDTDTSFGREAAVRWSYTTPFSDLAPRQKVMGVINTIAVLRTKASLLEEMKHAFEPRTTAKSPGIINGGSLPGPALAYGDCRLGILPFEVCRHLGFLDSDPMVAPSSTQSKLLRLVGASSLVASLKKGQAYLSDDPHLNSVLGPQLLDYAIRALSLFWSSQLLTPAFEIRGIHSDQIKQALYYADAFLFQTATQAKHIIRFSRTEYDDVASWLALLFSDAEPNASAHREGDLQHEDIPKLSEEAAANPQGEEAISVRSVQTPAQVPSAHKEEEGGMFGDFLSRFFTPQPSQPSQSPSIPPPQQPAQPKSTERETAPMNSLSAFASSVGEGLTSIVTSTARSAAKLIQGETPAPSSGSKESLVDQVTEERVSNILNALPEKVDGQFR